MKLESYVPKTLIIQQGDSGKKFYIILRGKCGVYIDKNFDNIA